MPTHSQLADAATLGLLAARQSGPNTSLDALSLVMKSLGADAASLVCADPFTSRYSTEVAIAYPAPVNVALCDDFLCSPWREYVVEQPLPPSISTEPAQTFRDGWLYQERLAPAGFRDGVTGALRRGAHLVGLVHLSSERAGHFDDDMCRVLAALLPALTVIADVVGREAASTDASQMGALVRGRDVATLPGRTVPLILEDARFLDLVARFEASTATVLSGYWGQAHDWWHVRLSPGAHSCGTLVQATPSPLPYGLTCRELDVLTEIAAGRGNHAIAERLRLSDRTVQTHVERVLRKTGSACRAELVGLALRASLLKLERSISACGGSA